MRWKTIVAVCAFLSILAAGGALVRAMQAAERENRACSFCDDYAYESPRFHKFVAESCEWSGGRDSRSFYTWMEQRFSQVNPKAVGNGQSISEMTAHERRRLLTARGTGRKSAEERAFAERMHRLIKTAITKFSLDRGFEFTNTVRYGERQCFLQSTLISAILQKAGISAGVVMVYANEKGALSNNGHAVVLMRLADGSHLIIDASEPLPVARHQGLFVRSGDYVYVKPVYESRTGRITAYLAAADNRRISPSEVATLDYDFLRSQFYYYRGERAVGGLLASTKTDAGLAMSEKALIKSLEISPNNPLSAYMLGRVRLLQGRQATAREDLTKALRLYSRFGWVPDGPKDYLAATPPQPPDKPGFGNSPKRRGG